MALVGNDDVQGKRRVGAKGGRGEGAACVSLHGWSGSSGPLLVRPALVLTEWKKNARTYLDPVAHIEEDVAVGAQVEHARAEPEDGRGQHHLLHDGLGCGVRCGVARLDSASLRAQSVMLSSPPVQKVQTNTRVREAHRTRRTRRREEEAR